MTQLQNATTPLGGLGDAADRGRRSIDMLAAAAEGAADRLNGVNGGGGGGGGGGGETVIITGDDSGGASIDAYVTDIRTRRGLRGMT